jgi:hypothetical protein
VTGEEGVASLEIATRCLAAGMPSLTSARYKAARAAAG